MPHTIPVAHDFTCPWCWVGLFQAKRLKDEFGFDIEWLGYELWPEELGWPEPKPSDPPPEDKPKTPGRLELLLWADGIELPKVEKPKRMRIHNAHEAVEYAKTEGVADAMVEALYRAYWVEGREIDNPTVIRDLAKGIVRDLEALDHAIATRRFADRIVGFDIPAHESGVYNVPTFFVGTERIAEHPYAYLRKKVREWLDTVGIYEGLVHPDPSEERPYVLLNMVATIDGKTVSGSRDDPVADLGSKVDHTLMKRIEASVDAVLLGAQTLRVTSPRWNPKACLRIVVTNSGEIPIESEFLTGGQSFVATSQSSGLDTVEGSEVWRVGKDRVDFVELLGRLRKLGVRSLLVLGGSEINAQLIRQHLVDELFLTVAPKVKLGRNLPTYAGGEPLDRSELIDFQLAEHHVVGDEVFLRYRRKS